MPPRISPLKDAMHHVVSKTDKTFKLDVKYINAVKGRGLFAKGDFCKGDFVVEYRGDMINDAELQRRRKRYHASCAAFMFDFKWRGKTWCIDASREDGSYGRIVNDCHKHPNCKMKKIDVNGKPHLCLFALDDIKEGEEIAYDYGGENYPWRTQMTSAPVNTSTASNSDPSLQSETQMDDESAQINSPQQMTSAPVNTSTASNSDPSLQSETQMDDESAQINSPQQMTSAPVNTSTASNSDPSLQSETQMDDESAQINSPQQMTSAPVNTSTASNSDPSLQSETQMDDESAQINSPQQMTSAPVNTSTASNSDPSLQSETQMDDESAQINSPQQMTSAPVNTSTASNSDPSLQSETQMDDESAQINSPQQIVIQLRNENDIFVPRLRRTKSIMMKDMDLQDSGELFDSTPESSDNYVPDTTSNSDSDSDVSLTLNPTKHQLLDELDMNESASVSSPDCDTTTSDKMHSLTSKTSETVEEPSSDCVFVNAYQKRDGGRVYNKRHYCLYCSKPYAKMARHLESSHANTSDVARALSFPKGSKERKKQLDYIRNKGNYAHNAAVMESGKGELVPFKRPPKKAQGEDFMHCAYCQGLFTRKVLWRHMRSCRLKPQSVPPKPGKNRVQSMCTYTGPVPSNMTKQLWGVISAMTPDPITDIIKNDRVITEIGQHLLNKGGLSAKNKQYVREKMRELGRLIHKARRVTSLKTMEDCVNPKKYMETVKAVKYTCGYDSETDKFMIPSLANKLGNSLVKVSKLLKAQGLISNDKQLVKNASEFLEVHESKWNEMISATALRNISEAKWNVPTIMPFTEDVQKMHTYLSEVQDKWFKTLSESPSTKAWMDLAKVCLAQMILFNRRREGEVSSMPLSAFLSRDTSDPHEDVDWALSEVEKKLCRHFTRVITRGKRGRPVPILLTPKMLSALEILVKQREACGVLKDNPYMFARPEAMTHFRGSDCLRGFAKVCGAKCPKSLTSTRLRKHAATLSTVLNMTDTEMDQLANFLGHDIRIHREFYRLPEKTLQLAKISKVLMALEQGRLAEFHGKNLDEIGIAPDEKVIDCDEEDGSIQEGHCSSTVDEPSSEVALPPTERNDMPPPPKRRRPPSDEEMPSGASAVRPSSKGKSTQKTPWQQTEVQAVERHMQRFITSLTVPAKSDCEKCLKAEPGALKNRDWKTVKFYIYNRITAYKKKFQCK
ncbi:uncharacterized protein LOC130103414 [Rhinichthys klamathensis goyatoka]|uniref:uncharacterized protein LOC130090480 n=1 Tax=Rhinichthys klamathensis goyatoka TaxID=3034132 RepID=UPI0024B4D995|nr:uncharacterized protein LOC130090480 [Rhinichthys klamathensis goyatoka]XP_056125634.1 uncharacterized protein LOC130103414 [Rhinichthys klamathensis goyatoka]